MLCRSPYVAAGLAYPCGQCMPCRLNRRRVWTHRIMLESLLHGDNAFVTLTYSDEHLPSNGSLVPKHPQDWLKRFRKAIEPLRIRYYLVGEYGDETWRPHYHAALFGYSSCVRGRTKRRAGFSRPEWSSCCATCDTVGSTWGFGDIDVGTLETNSAQYLAGYVTKKMTASDDDRLLGRHPCPP